MTKTTTLAVFLTLGLPMLLVPSGVRAEEGGQTGAAERRHRPELFLGVSHTEGSDEFASGIGYEYRLGMLLGVGGFVEYVDEEGGAWTFGLPLYAHPYKGVRLLLAPGWEVRDVKTVKEVKADAQDDGKVTKESEQSLLMRSGIAYEFEAGRWSITPEVNLDLIEGGRHALVYGISLGCGF